MQAELVEVEALPDHGADVHQPHGLQDLTAGAPVVHEEYGVGRPAVREALQTLERSGIVEISHGERARVVVPTAQLLVAQIAGGAQHLLRMQPAMLEHMKEVRVFLECGTARMAAERATLDDVARLRKRLREGALNDKDIELALADAKRLLTALPAPTAVARSITISRIGGASTPADSRKLMKPMDSSPSTSCSCGAKMRRLPCTGLPVQDSAESAKPSSQRSASWISSVSNPTADSLRESNLGSGQASGRQ